MAFSDFKLDNLEKYKNIHMIGIGGISMSGIAEILHDWKYNVSGSDANNSEIIEKLKENGISVCIGHDINLVSKADLVVYSAAIKINDPEIVYALENNIPVIERADFLGYLTKLYENTICISGTHGKTTTTSMVSICFVESLYDPTIQVGAILNEINGNYRVGNDKYFIIEACEYVESFLKFHPKCEIILNIDNDHLDYFKTFDNIKKSFCKYVKLLPNDGILIVNADDKNCLDLGKHTNAKFITYGIENSNADYVAKNIIFNNDGFASFDVYYKEKFLTNISLSVPGIHNVCNALACFATCKAYNIDDKYIKSGLLKFKGAHRRFEYKGKFNDITIYDDYAHHPTEILSVANALKCKKYNESWAIFQPHTYSRTKSLLDDFANVLTNFDNIIITDIYAAREENVYNISSIDLVDKINKNGKYAKYISDFNDISQYIKENAKENDIVITIGAGTIVNVCDLILEKETVKK